MECWVLSRTYSCVEDMIDRHVSGVHAYGLDEPGWGWRSSGRRVGARQLEALRVGLGERDRAVLAAVGLLHVAGTGHLRRMVFGDLSEIGAARAAQRHTARLFRVGLLERLDRRVGGLRPGSSAFLWRLSSAGARLALPEVAHWRRREPGLAHLAHVVEVADLVVGLHEHARTGACEVIEVQTEPACWRPFHNRWGHQRMLKPDLRTTVGIGERAMLHRFVEIDRDTEHRPVLSRKIIAYVDCWRGRGEHARAGVFPGVLWVVPTQRRGQVIAELCQRLGVRGMFEVATRTEAVEALVAVPNPDGGTPWTV